MQDIDDNKVKFNSVKLETSLYTRIKKKSVANGKSLTAEINQALDDQEKYHKLIKDLKLKDSDNRE